MDIVKEKLKKEIESVIKNTSIELKNAPNIKCFKENYKMFMERHEALDRKIKQTQLISDKILLRRFTI